MSGEVCPIHAETIGPLPMRNCPGCRADIDRTIHLRPDAPVAICGRCGRQTVAAENFGAEDRMPQPDGYPCGGRFSDPTKPQQRPAPCTMLGHTWMIVVNGAHDPVVAVCERCGRHVAVGVTDDHEPCDRQIRRAQADADRLYAALEAVMKAVGTDVRAIDLLLGTDRDPYDALAEHDEAVPDRG